ncbi:MAG: tetratricopeptide repeat protein [Planctomycetes bacterium]|nr:tetratricopeptide repeat protein [Planctomycetota bacterium]
MRRLAPALVVGAAIAVACALAAPGGVPPEAVGSDGAGADEPTEATLTPEQRASMDSFVHRFRRAQQQFGGGHDKEAEEILRQLLTEQPDAAAVHHALAYIQWFQRRTDAAMEHFAEAARLAPEDGAIRRDYGLRLCDLGRAAEALPHVEKAAALLDPDVETICALGRALAANGRPADAERRYREALELDPASVDARALLARHIGGERPDEALKLLEGINPNWVDVVAARAFALERLGRWKEAAASHVRMSELAGPAASQAAVATLRDAAEGLVRTGDTEHAVAVATRWTASDRVPGLPAPGGRPGLRASFCLAVARAGAGDAAGALEALDAADVPGTSTVQAKTHLRLVRAHLLLQAGRPDDARKELAAVAAVEDVPPVAFERALARFVTGTDPRAVGNDLALIQAVAAAQKSRVNDVDWAMWLRAKLTGDPATAPADAKAAVLRGIDHSNPPGEHPGFLLLGVR